MSWTDGVSQCWPLATDCVVWWDAWAVVVAAIALFVAWLGLAVAAGSAGAVFWLGFQANRLGQVSRDIAQDDRSREGAFILAYIFPEVLDAFSKAGAMVSVRDTFLEYFPGAPKEGRKDALSTLRSIAMPRTSSHFDRLHVLEPDIGRRLARILSTLDLLNTAYGHLIEHENDEHLLARLNDSCDHVESLRDDLFVVMKAAKKARAQE